jgi:hypothetical protein
MAILETATLRAKAIAQNVGVRAGQDWSIASKVYRIILRGEEDEQDEKFRRLWPISWHCC